MSLWSRLERRLGDLHERSEPILKRMATGLPRLGVYLELLTVALERAEYGAIKWVSDARIGLAGTTAGFLQYGFYGTDLSNRVLYLGVKGPHGAFNAVPTCAGFRSAVNAADLDYLITAPFLNFIEPGKPIRSPEAGWLRGERGVVPVGRSGPVTIWEVRGRLDPAACGPANAPLREIPQQPTS